MFDDVKDFGKQKTEPTIRVSSFPFSMDPPSKAPPGASTSKTWSSGTLQEGLRATGVQAMKQEIQDETEIARLRVELEAILLGKKDVYEFIIWDPTNSPGFGN